MGTCAGRQLNCVVARESQASDLLRMLRGCGRRWIKCQDSLLVTSHKRQIFQSLQDHHCSSSGSWDECEIANTSLQSAYFNLEVGGPISHDIFRLYLVTPRTKSGADNWQQDLLDDWRSNEIVASMISCSYRCPAVSWVIVLQHSAESVTLYINTFQKWLWTHTLNMYKYSSGNKEQFGNSIMEVVKAILTVVW